MLSLLAELMMGRPIEDSGFSHWMDRGSEMEAEAVNFYEFQRDIETVKIGFVTNDDVSIGASPDRFVGDDGLLEIKCPSPGIHVGYLMQSGGAYEKYRVQVQGQLWVTGRQWSDTLSYHPEMPMALYRVERDDAYIELLAAEVTAFSAKLEILFAEVITRGWVRQKREKTLPTRDILQTMREVMVEANARRGE